MSSADKKKIDNVKTDTSLSTSSENPVQNKVVTAAINKAQTDATDAKNAASTNKEELTKTQQLLNTIKTSYLKSTSVSGNTLTIKDQNDSEVKFYNTTYGVVSSSTDGLAPAIGSSVSSIIGNQTDEWVLTSTKGETPTWRKLPVNAFLNTNDNTTYTLSGALSGNTFISTLKPSSGVSTSSTVPAMVAASASTNGKAGLVPAPSAGAQGKVLSGAGTWISFPTLSITDNETGNAITDVTVSEHSITLKRGSNFSLQGHIHSTSNVTSLTGYSKASSIAALAASDTLNAALGKLEYKADSAWNWISSVTATDNDDEYINKWGEIVDFLDSVKEGTDILDEFVTRKTDQPITGAKSFKAPLYLGSYGVLGFGSSIDGNYTDGIDLEPEDNAVWLATTGGGSKSAGILLDGNTIKLWSPMDNSPVFIDSDDGANYEILHSGNSSVSKSGETLTVTINGTSQSLTNTKYTTLPNPYSVLFKDTANTTVFYNGSSALDLTDGIYYALNSKYIQCPDTRSTSIIPSRVSAGVSFDFKDNSVTNLSAAYAGIMTFRPYGSETDWSGGPIHNLAFDENGLHHRIASSNTWGVWSRILTSTNYTDYVNTTNFPGLHEVGTVTKVSTGAGLTGGNITTSGTISLSTSGVSAGSYGPSSNVTGSHDSTISIPYITIDEYGRITAAKNVTYTAMNWFPNELTWENGTTDGPVGILKGVGMTDVAFPAIPSASLSYSGIVTTDIQDFSGRKRFVNGIHIGNKTPANTSNLSDLKISFGDIADEAWIGEMEDKVLYLHGEDGLYLENDGYGLQFDYSGYFYGAGVKLGKPEYKFSYLYCENIGSYLSRCANGYFSDKVYAKNGFFQDSDERLKNILKPVKVNLDDLTKLRKVFYTWKNDNSNSKQLGMIAQDVYELYPELVTIDKETGYMSLAYDRLSVISLEAIDELYKIVKDLKLENEKLRYDLKILNY